MRKILVGTDTSASADLVAQAAAGLALARDAELLVLYVKPSPDARDVFDPNKLVQHAPCSVFIVDTRTAQ